MRSLGCPGWNHQLYPPRRHAGPFSTCSALLGHVLGINRQPFLLRRPTLPHHLAHVSNLVFRNGEPVWPHALEKNGCIRNQRYVLLSVEILIRCAVPTSSVDIAVHVANEVGELCVLAKKNESGIRSRLKHLSLSYYKGVICSHGFDSRLDVETARCGSAYYVPKTEKEMRWFDERPDRFLRRFFGLPIGRFCGRQSTYFSNDNGC